jgi:hypothetical protein
VGGHIAHATVEAGGQPVQQTWLGVRKVDAGNTDL